MQPIGQLDDDDPGILGDGQQELAVVLDLLLRRGPESEARDLGQPVHDPGHFGPELPGDLLGADVRVLDHVVQQRGDDGGRVEQLFHQGLGDRDGMLDEVLARHPLLAPVGRGAEPEGAIDLLEIQPVGVALEEGPEIRCDVRQGTSHGTPSGVSDIPNNTPSPPTGVRFGRAVIT